MTADSPVPGPAPIPPDDSRRALTVATPDDPGLTHLSVVGDTYTILLSGDDTGGRFTIIDMYVPPGGGPPPHRHDFEETFIITEGQLDVTFRGTSRSASAGTTINVAGQSWGDRSSAIPSGMDSATPGSMTAVGWLKFAVLRAGWLVSPRLGSAPSRCGPSRPRSRTPSRALSCSAS